MNTDGGNTNDELRVQRECRAKLRTIQIQIGNILARHANTVKHLNPVVEKRSALLFAAVCKLQESSDAILLLGDHGYVDEMNILLRSQVELVVNVCYLQHANDDDLAGFIHHDPIAGYIAMQDIVKASKGALVMPDELAQRVTTQAEDAKNASGLSLTSRNWDKKNIKQKADAIDRELDTEDFAGMLATIYVTGSGCVHGSYKTLHKHIMYLVHSEEDTPWHTMFGANNVIHGIGYVQLVFARYFAKRFDLPNERLDELAHEGQLVCDEMDKDYRRLKSSGSTRRVVPASTKST